MSFEAPPSPVYSTLLPILAGLEAPHILELGTKAAERGSWHHKSWCPHGDWVLSDFEDGNDVDVVADAHDLTSAFGHESFDVVIAASVWEHLARPWIATMEVGRVLKPGGLFFCATHHTFPEHAYPHDYWRFSTASMRVMFEDAGLEVLEVGYAYPCKIVPQVPIDPWCDTAPAWLTVEALGRRS